MGKFSIYRKGFGKHLVSSFLSPFNLSGSKLFQYFFDDFPLKDDYDGPR